MLKMKQLNDFFNHGTHTDELSNQDFNLSVITL